MDKKPVQFISNFHDPSIITTTNRKQKDGSIITINCPQIVKDYNNNMGHVDKADMLKSTYAIDRKSKKWWPRIFWHFVDVTIVNAFIIYKQLYSERSLELKEFRLAVANGLIGAVRYKKKGRKTVVNKKIKPNIPISTRTSQAIHMLLYTNTCRRCAYCYGKKVYNRTNVICKSCNVPLCINTNCFFKFHS